VSFVSSTCDEVSVGIAPLSHHREPGTEKNSGLFLRVSLSLW